MRLPKIRGEYFAPHEYKKFWRLNERKLLPGKYSGSKSQVWCQRFGVTRYSIWSFVGFEKRTFLHLTHHKAPTFICIVCLLLVWCGANGISTGPVLEAEVRLGVREKVGWKSDSCNAFLQTWRSKGPHWQILLGICSFDLGQMRFGIVLNLEGPDFLGGLWVKFFSIEVCFPGCQRRASLRPSVFKTGEIYPNW